MRVSIIGTGYVGLITGVCLAHKGHTVNCYDINKKIINSINNGVPPIYEQNLKKYLQSVLNKRKFNAKLISEINLSQTEIVIIAVGTPSNKGDIDLSYIEKVSSLIGKKLRTIDKFVSIVVKSTVVPSTTDTIVKNIIEKESSKKLGQFGIGMNPEFLREGSAIEDFMNPDRIVFGHDDKKTLKLLKKLYKPWSCDKIAVNTRTAEMIKYANNSLLATQISAVNELANIASGIKNIDILDVMKGVHLDKRWSPIISGGKRIYPDILSYLIPGCGFGGSCFPKDVEAIRAKAKDVKVDSYILDSVLKVNDKQPHQVVELLKSNVKLKNKKILFLGLAFKDGTDDTRESVSIKIINILLKYHCKIFAHDPIAIDNAKRELDTFENLKYINKWDNLISSIDIIIIGTKWTEYKKLSSSIYKKNIHGKILLDARRFFKPEDFPNTLYLTIGRNINA